MYLKDFDFHDALLKELRIERDAPGYKDEINLFIGISKNKDIKLVFKDCFQANFDMNFGIIADETIYDIYKSVDSEDLELLKKKWLKIGGDVEDLNLYIIETNSTNSVIKIFAKSYKIEKLSYS